MAQSAGSRDQMFENLRLKGLFRHQGVDDVFVDGHWIQDVEVEQYGEGFEGFANHASDVSHLDRQIMEDCVFQGGQVLAAHESSQQAAFHMRPDVLANRIDCTAQQADELLAYWVILDASRKMVEEFIRWIKAKGVEAALGYFKGLAMEMTKISDPEPDDLLTGSFQMASLTEKPAPESSMKIVKVDGEEHLIVYHKTETVPNYYEAEEELGMKVNDIDYHPITHTECDDWLSRQPSKVWNIFNDMRAAKTFFQLGRLAKKLYNGKFSQDQKNFLWSYYNSRRQYIHDSMSPDAKGLVRRIEAVKDDEKELAQLGYTLYKIQERGTSRILASEWPVVWKTYRQYKPKESSQSISTS